MDSVAAHMDATCLCIAEKYHIVGKNSVFCLPPFQIRLLALELNVAKIKHFGAYGVENSEQVAAQSGKIDFSF